MLQIANLSEYTARDIPQLLERITPILSKRAKLHEKYSRLGSDKVCMFDGTDKNTVLPFEKYITDLATGYLSGKPIYSVDFVNDENRKRIIQETLGKAVPEDDYAERMKVIIDYITNYNDDGDENHNLIHDVLEYGACYEICYENENNEYVYAKYDPLQTVATWDYSVPSNLTGIIRVWEERTLDGLVSKKVELTDCNGSRVYKVNGQMVVEEDKRNHNWGDVPGFAVETDFAIFEGCEDVIGAYEQLIQNVRNTFQYNDADCKLMLSGYSPENAALITDDDGNLAPNPARTAEDNLWRAARTVYVGEGGGVEWLTKPVDANGVSTILKIYVDLMFQLAGIPNTSDLAFNGADLNASAIDRKFYVMNMATAKVIELLKKAYLRRWELIFNKINAENVAMNRKGYVYDFRDIKIELPKNLPANNDEMTDSVLKLKDIISKQTLIERLGFNYISEKQKMEEETEDSFVANIERMKGLANGPTEADNSEMEEDGANPEEETE